MAKWRGIILFGTDPSYVPPSGFSAPRTSGWSFSAVYDAADQATALTKLQTTRDAILNNMHEAYQAQAASVSDIATYRDVLRENYAPGTQKGGQLDSQSRLPAEPEWCGIVTLFPTTPGSQGRHFIHGLARTGNGQPPPFAINAILWPLVAAAGNLKNILVADTFLYRKAATTHFPQGSFPFSTGVAGPLDVRKVGLPFDNSPRRLHRRDRDTRPASP